MSPHKYMTQLDEAGTAYVVRLGSSGEDREVFSHSKDWLQLSAYGGLREWVNIRHVGFLKVIEQ